MIYSGLPKGSSLSPLLFNIYISSVSRELEEANVLHLIYADDIVLFCSHTNINIATNFLKNSLNILNNSLNSIQLSVSPAKSNVIIFTRKRRYETPHFFLGGVPIPIVPRDKYLGLILDSELRLKSHILYITSFVSKWSNLLRSLASSWWGSHPKPILQIYKAIIRAQIEYGRFLFSSASLSNLK